MIKFKKYFSPSKGFTLIELVLYMGILTILVTAMATIFSTILSVQLDATATASVDQDGRYILSKLVYDMKTSTGSAVPANPGQTTTTMQLQNPGNTLNYTYSLDSNSNLQLVNDNGTNVLNSYDSQVTGLSFQRIGSGGSSDTVRVNFTVTSRIRQPKGYESKSFQTTLSRN